MNEWVNHAESVIVEPLLAQHSIIGHPINCDKSNCNQHQSKSIDWHYR